MELSVAERRGYLQALDAYTQQMVQLRQHRETAVQLLREVGAVVVR
jgi:hypothetical protein